MTEGERRMAPDFAEEISRLSGMSPAELDGIACMLAGEKLRDGEMYFDLAHPERSAIEGAEGLSVPQGSCYVRKTSIGSEAWLRLIAGQAGPGMAD